MKIEGNDHTLVCIFFLWDSSMLMSSSCLEANAVERAPVGKVKEWKTAYYVRPLLSDAA